jgi:galacturonokinase
MIVNDPSVDRLKSEVARRFAVAAATVRTVFSPYRICPLGAHIDHQLGPVTAMAIDRGVMLAYAPSGSREVHLSSLAFSGNVAFDLDAVPDRREGDWGNFPRGAVRALQREHRLRTGIVGVTSGQLGEGGLSSSAAIGVAYLLAFEEANELEVTAADNISLDQAIENGYLGLRNGILDQAAIILSRRDHLTVIDCATVTHELIPRPSTAEPFGILIAFSGLRQALVGTDYNRRVDECATAARTLLEAAGRSSPQPRLGQISAAEYDAGRAELEGPPARRAEHFFAEVDRVERGVEAWKKGDLAEFGRLISASGASSINNYECGCPPLIDLYELLIETEGVYGARFSGAGFRGCCVALVKPEAAAVAAETVRARYAEKHPDLAAEAPVLLCEPDDGARMI